MTGGGGTSFNPRQLSAQALLTGCYYLYISSFIE
ncbi:hypothetical protein FHW96_001461 [Novosphingobium sp. SG751A]|nr:hypothetical protein [Novosphingobium sp. SG751A]